MGDSKIALKDDDDDDDDGMAVDPKVEAIREGTPSSIESTPEPDILAGSEAQDAPLPQKRKGGRKPVCLYSFPSLPSRHLWWPISE